MRYPEAESGRGHGRPEPAQPISGTRLNAAIAAVTGGALLLAEVVSSIERGTPFEFHSAALLVLGALSIVLLERWALVTAVVVGLCLPLYYLTGQTDDFTAWLLLFVTLMRMAASGHRAATATTMVTALLLFAAAEGAYFEPWRALAILAWMIVVGAAAEISRGRAAYTRAVEERAAEAERSREEEARRRATEERLRIARELHDVLAHNISLINVQATAVAHRSDQGTDRAAIEVIRDASRDTLRELRSILGVLRHADAGAPVSPVSGVEGLTDLVSRTRDSGLEVRLSVEGTASGTGGAEEAAPPERNASVPAEGGGAVEGTGIRDVPAPIGLAIYRLVQESLTNVQRHSNAKAAQVTITLGAADVTVLVTDDGTAVPGAVTEGDGLRGMRERVSALSGRFSAGPRDGGFGVQAVLPLH